MHVQTRLGARWRRRHRDRAWHEEQPAGGVFRNLTVAGVGQEGLELDETTIIEISVRIRLDGDAVALDASLASMHRVRIGTPLAHLGGNLFGPLLTSVCSACGLPP